jgi:hypothetical protein
MPERGTHPVDWLRGIALSLERLAAQGVAGGVVRGASEQLRAEIPEGLDAQIRKLVGSAAEGVMRGAVEEARRLVPELRPTTQDLLIRVKCWLDRSEAEAAARAKAIHAPGEIARVTAAGAVAGAADQLGVALPALTRPAADLAEHVGRAAVRGVAEELGRQARAAARNPAFRLVAGGAAVAGTMAGILAVLLLATRRR